MAPLTPFWQQPSHGEIQEVVIGKEGFTSKSFSKVTVAPFGLFTKLDFLPCTRATVPTYATIQMGRDAHLNLNSDLVYINHSCEPSLILDMPTLSILAGPQGLRPGSELTFFYPSTEWAMAQPFDCFCGTPSCKGRIAGASDMDAAQLEGMWLNGYIRDMLAEKQQRQQRQQQQQREKLNANGTNVAVSGSGGGNVSVSAGNDSANGNGVGFGGKWGQEGGMRNGEKREWDSNGVVHGLADLVDGGSARTGPTSRELSGEMGGDTTFN